jgi:gamma-glutamyltranspeptidase
MNITDDLQLHTVPPPGSGIIMSFILELLSTYDNKPEVLNNFNDSVTMYHRIAEACKHAFAKRTYLGDPLVGDPEQIDQVEEVCMYAIVYL